MKYISMLNPYTIKYLWENDKGKNYITDYINKLLNINEKYTLLDFYNNKYNSVRSYSIFDSNKVIVLVDFNLNKRNIDDDLAIVKYLESTINKKIYLIMLNNFKGNDCFGNNIFNKFKDNSFIFANSYEKQKHLEPDITKILYLMDDETKKLYLHENSLMS